MTHAVQTISLSKSYRHFEVLKAVSFNVAPGQCFALFGPNGAGKTTLLKILATLQQPTEGRFEVLGHDGVRARGEIRRLLLLLAHGSYLYNDLDALENLRFSLALRGVTPTERALRLALDRVGIGAFAEFKIRNYSEGMKKRLSIARAMLMRPPVLLMDEPYASLDERGVRIMNHFIHDATQGGAAVVMTTHNRAQTAVVAQRAGVLHHGVLREIPVQELLGTHELF